MFVHEFHLLAAERHWRNERGGGGGVGRGFWAKVPVFFIQCDGRRKGDAGKPAGFQCFLSLLNQIFSPYKSRSLELFIPVSSVPLGCFSPHPLLFFFYFFFPPGGFSLVIFGFGVCEDVRLEVGRLGELLIAAVERADVGPVAGVDPNVRAQVEVQREALPAAFEGALGETRGAGEGRGGSQSLR